MKIAIESNDGVTINSPFTRTNGYLVYEVGESGIKNSEFIKASQDAQQQNLNDCRTIISRGMDRNHFLELKKKGIDVFITFKSSAKDAVQIFMKENLLRQSTFH
jgi:predicted Fe-Mo cluster-binding NifX family protein